MKTIKQMLAESLTIEQLDEEAKVDRARLKKALDDEDAETHLAYDDYDIKLGNLTVVNNNGVMKTSVKGMVTVYNRKGNLRIAVSISGTTTGTGVLFNYSFEGKASLANFEMHVESAFDILNEAFKQLGNAGYYVERTVASSERRFR